MPESETPKKKGPKHLYPSTLPPDVENILMPDGLIDQVVDRTRPVPAFTSQYAAQDDFSLKLLLGPFRWVLISVRRDRAVIQRGRPNYFEFSTDPQSEVDPADGY